MKKIAAVLSVLLSLVLAPRAVAQESAPLTAQALLDAAIVDACRIAYARLHAGDESGFQADYVVLRPEGNPAGDLSVWLPGSTALSLFAQARALGGKVVSTWFACVDARHAKRILAAHYLGL